jgi:hypothetical protein
MPEHVAASESSKISYFNKDLLTSAQALKIPLDVKDLTLHEGSRQVGDCIFRVENSSLNCLYRFSTRSERVT